MGATAAEPLLSVKNLSKRFPVGKTFFGKPNKWVHAVNNVSFDIMPGEVGNIRNDIFLLNSFATR